MKQIILAILALTIIGCSPNSRSGTSDNSTVSEEASTVLTDNETVVDEIIAGPEWLSVDNVSISGVGTAPYGVVKGTFSLTMPHEFEGNFYPVVTVQKLGGNTIVDVTPPPDLKDWKLMETTSDNSTYMSEFSTASYIPLEHGGNEIVITVKVDKKFKVHAVGNIDYHDVRVAGFVINDGTERIANKYGRMQITPYSNGIKLRVEPFHATGTDLCLTDGMPYIWQTGEVDHIESKLASSIETYSTNNLFNGWIEAGNPACSLDGTSPTTLDDIILVLAYESEINFDFDQEIGIYLRALGESRYMNFTINSEHFQHPCISENLCLWSQSDSEMGTLYFPDDDSGTSFRIDKDNPDFDGQRVHFEYEGHRIQVWMSDNGRMADGVYLMYQTNTYGHGYSGVADEYGRYNLADVLAVQYTFFIEVVRNKIQRIIKIEAGDQLPEELMHLITNLN